MGLNGIDISSWQDDLAVGNMATCDFVIVKATGGVGYSNECFRRHADETLAAGKLLGCYHYARDRGYEGSAEAEADHFIDAFRPYIGKVDISDARSVAGVATDALAGRSRRH